MFNFEFDAAKSESHRNKHGMDFDEAQVLWNDPMLLEIRAMLWPRSATPRSGTPIPCRTACTHKKSKTLAAFCSLCCLLEWSFFSRFSRDPLVCRVTYLKKPRIVLSGTLWIVSQAADLCGDDCLVGRARAGQSLFF
jgi:hypothetical protein